LKQGKSKVDAGVAKAGTTINGWQISGAPGDSAHYNGDWLARAVAAQAGIYGNSPEEAMTGRRSVVQTSRLQEGQQVCVDRFRLRGRHAVWEVLVGLKRPVFQKLRRQRPGIRVRNDLIVLTVHHQHRYGDFL
jgi:hypothetical protein